MELNRVTVLNKYAQSRWGLATRERHSIEPVTGGFIVRSCAPCFLCEQ